MNRLQEIEARLTAITLEVETRGAELTAEQLTALNTEVDELRTERAGLSTGQEQRAALLARIAEGREPGTTTVRSFPTPGPPGGETRSVETTDPTDRQEYRNAFMEYVCRGVPFPAELRADGVTGITEAGAVIPKTTLQEIIRKLESYGAIYAKVRKLNIQGGVSVPILTLKPTAVWVGEKASEDQKIKADEAVTFNYYGLECKIAQTLLTSNELNEVIMREFVALATEAIVIKLETSIFKGTGAGQALGVLRDPRVPSANSITLSSGDFASWKGWKQLVFGKMKKAYRNGIFVMAQGTFDGHIDGMVDETGQPIGRVNYGIANDETYRFGGKAVETVEDEVIASYDEAGVGDVVAVFFNPSDYAINGNMQMTVVKWTDHDENQVKNKAIIICDGKLLDPNGVLIIKKGA